MSFYPDDRVIGCKPRSTMFLAAEIICTGSKTVLLRSHLGSYYWRSERGILMVQRDIWKPWRTAIRTKHRSAVVDECADAEILWRACLESPCIIGAVLWTLQDVHCHGQHQCQGDVRSCRVQAECFSLSRFCAALKGHWRACTCSWTVCMEEFLFEGNGQGRSRVSLHVKL